MATPSGNNNQFFGQKVSIPGINVENAGDNQLILKDDYSSRIYYNSNGVETVLLGLRAKNSSNGLSANQQGLFVSKDGIKVTQATDAQLIFNSNQNVFKIVSSGTHTTTYSFGAKPVGSGFTQDYQDDTIVHGLGFIPAVVVYASFVNIGGVTTQIPVVNGSVNSYLFGGGSGFAFAITQYDVSVDSTNLYLGISRWGNLGNGAYNSTLSAASGSVNFKYYLLQETAN